MYHTRLESKVVPVSTMINLVRMRIFKILDSKATGVAQRYSAYLERIKVLV